MRLKLRLPACISLYEPLSVWRGQIKSAGAQPAFALTAHIFFWISIWSFLLSFDTPQESSLTASSSSPTPDWNTSSSQILALPLFSWRVLCSQKHLMTQMQVSRYLRSLKNQNINLYVSTWGKLFLKNESVLTKNKICFCCLTALHMVLSGAARKLPTLSHILITINYSKTLVEFSLSADFSLKENHDAQNKSKLGEGFRRCFFFYCSKCNTRLGGNYYTTCATILMPHSGAVTIATTGLFTAAQRSC